jgi:dolichyl-phosphate beta-glucosyltransferase
MILYFSYAHQIHAFARKESQPGDSAASNSSFRISDIPVAAFGSRAHLEEKALATVQSSNAAHFICFILRFFGNFVSYSALLNHFACMPQRKWYRNFLMKGFHLVVLLTAGSGIRDTQVILPHFLVIN